jgi:preprotein translocase subunit SecB
MNASLQKAIDTFRIHDVYLRNSVAQCVNGFEPKYSSDIDKLEMQTKHAVREAQIAQLDETQWLVRVFIELGVRLVDSRIEQEDESVRAFIEAEYIAEYTVDEELEQACIDEFALKNASYHVWPYWREFLMSQCGRMHLPRLMLPTMQLAHHRHNELHNATAEEANQI